MSPTFSIRLAALKDVARVIALADSIPEAPHWNEEMYRDFITPPQDAIQRKALLVAAHAEQVYGFAAVTVLAAEAELESIAVSEEARRLGLGRALMDAVVHWCEADAVQVLRLEVRAANSPALAFYRSTGMQQTGLRRGYYRSPDDDGVLMLRDVGKPT